MHRSSSRRPAHLVKGVVSSSIAVALVMAAATPSIAAVPTAVIANEGVDEYDGTASSGYLVWTQNSADRPYHYNSYARPEGEPRIRLNELGTQSFSAAVYDSAVLYQEFREGDSDLKLYDLQTGDRSNPGQGVNTPYDEYQAGISDAYLFFTRSRFGGKWVKLVLYNRHSGESQVLAQGNPRHQYLISNQVNGRWAVWESCSLAGGQYSKCNVFRYHIGTGTTFRLPNPGKQQYGSAVTSDGVVYFFRVGGSASWHCGANGKLLRYPVGGPATVIASLPDSKDLFSTFALEEGDGSTSLFFDRVDCETFQRDIYMVANADSA